MLGVALQPVVLAIAQAACSTHTGCEGALCGGSTVSAIAAAFATEGLWVQADLLDYLTLTAFGLWAPLLYCISALAGMIGVATGSPPRNYMWFFLGPPIFAWLVATREPVQGVEWMVANEKQDQRQVWKLSEVGLVNNDYVKRYEVGISSDAAPDGHAYVATPFLWFDSVISGGIQWLVQWTGVYTKRGGQLGKTNISENPSNEQNAWYLLTNLKWGYLENITAAKLHNADLRDAFVSFLSSECGDAMAKAINDESFIIANNNKSGSLPPSVFNDVNHQGDPDYTYAQKKLSTVWVPMPRAVRNLFALDPNTGAATTDPTAPSSDYNPASDGSFVHFMDTTFSSAKRNEVLSKDAISCVTLFDIIVQGFRWETGHVYYQLVSSRPDGLSELDMIYDIFYGWDLRLPDGTSSSGALLNAEQQKKFLKDLILVHLFRNEMALMPQMGDSRYAPSQRIENYLTAYHRSVGQNAKWAEVYTWALMLPYVQGILLYFLAMLYPFAAILMVVPGWHKAIFTWGSFWLWAKLWDLGFAVVMVLERSIWAMLSNSTGARHLSQKISEMGTWHEVLAACRDGASDIACNPKFCPIPEISSQLGSDVSSSAGELLSLFKIFDRSMLLSSRMDLDLANGYYIYLMAALYGLVPIVTGQLVLGARSGAANLMGNMINPLQTDAGKGASSGYTGDYNQRLKVNEAGVSQEGYAKGARKSGFAQQAMQMSNDGLDAGVAGSAYGTEQGLLGRAGQLVDNNAARNKAHVGRYGAEADRIQGLGNAYGQGLQSAGDSLEKILGPIAGGGGAASTGGGSGNPSLGVANGVARGVGGLVSARAGQKATDMRWDAAQANWGIEQGRLDKQNGLLGGMQDAAISQFGAQAAQSGLNQGGNRKLAQADYAAKMSGWEARRNWGNNLGGASAAVGVLAGNIAPQEKPTGVESMAMAGMIGGDASKAAHYSDPYSGGAYYGKAGAVTDSFKGKYSGGQFLQGADNTNYAQATSKITDTTSPSGYFNQPTTVSSNPRAPTPAGSFSGAGQSMIQGGQPTNVGGGAVISSGAGAAPVAPSNGGARGQPLNPLHPSKVK